MEMEEKRKMEAVPSKSNNRFLSAVLFIPIKELIISFTLYPRSRVLRAADGT